MSDAVGLQALFDEGEIRVNRRKAPFRKFNFHWGGTLRKVKIGVWTLTLKGTSFETEQILLWLCSPGNIQSRGVG